MDSGNDQSSHGLGTVKYIRLHLKTVTRTDEVVQPMTSLSNGGMSTEFIWKILNGPKDEPVSPTFYPYYVDVSYPPLSDLS